MWDVFLLTKTSEIMKDSSLRVNIIDKDHECSESLFQYPSSDMYYWWHKTRYIVYIDVVTQDGVCFEIERLEHLRKENDFWQSEKKW